MNRVPRRGGLVLQQFFRCEGVEDWKYLDHFHEPSTQPRADLRVLIGMRLFTLRFIPLLELLSILGSSLRVKDHQIVAHGYPLARRAHSLSIKSKFVCVRQVTEVGWTRKTTSVLFLPKGL